MLAKNHVFLTRVEIFEALLTVLFWKVLNIQIVNIGIMITKIAYNYYTKDG